MPSSVRIKDPATGRWTTTVKVPGEGTWTVDPATGRVRFTPLRSFTGAATPMHLICDFSHRLLALSRSREKVCRVPASALLGGCGGSTRVEPYAPNRIVAFGDELSLIGTDRKSVV